MSLSARLLNGDLRALARLATYVENDDDIGRAALSLLYSQTGRAHVIGITGPPGSGKSTLINALIGEFRRRSARVGVVAVDPTSPYSGGAALGDRIRMMERHADPGVFIRSMASRGLVGGLAAATAGVVHLLDAAGFDVVLIETVGVGQEETAVARLAETTVLIQVPGLGDSIQTIKAGILEVADIFVVGKSDRPGAADLANDLRQMLRLTAGGEDGWRVPVLPVAAVRAEGIRELADRITAHRQFLVDSGALASRRRLIAEAEVMALLRLDLERRLLERIDGLAVFAEEVARVSDRHSTPVEASTTIQSQLNWP